MSTVAHPSTMPGGLEVQDRRELASGGVIEFEFAPAGWLTQDGLPRERDHRAYYWTPQADCVACAGTGRAPSEKRPDGTIKCKPCDGTGLTKRQRMASVSTVLDCILPKPGLPPWAEARGIEGAIEAVRRDEINLAVHANDEAVGIVRALRLGADRARDDAATRGLNVHDLLREYMQTGEAPTFSDHPIEQHGYIRALSRWLLATKLEPETVEEMVCSPDDGYAGRTDLVARGDGFRIRFDAKTQERGGIYESAHVQVKLYDRAAVALGDEPADLLKVVVFAENGEFREMACMADDKAADCALAWWRAIKPVSSACEGANRIEREARR